MSGDAVRDRLFAGRRFGTGRDLLLGRRSSSAASSPPAGQGRYWRLAYLWRTEGAARRPQGNRQRTACGGNEASYPERELSYINSAAARSTPSSSACQSSGV